MGKEGRSVSGERSNRREERRRRKGRRGKEEKETEIQTDGDRERD